MVLDCLETVHHLLHGHLGASEENWSYPINRVPRMQNVYFTTTANLYFQNIFL